MNNVEFGMPALLEMDTLEQSAALCARLGLKFVELNMNLPYLQPGILRAEQLNALKKEYGVYFTLHLEETLDPCDFNPRVAAAYTETALEAIELAKRVGAPTLNMHLVRGIYFTLPDQKLYLYDKYRAAYLSGIERFRDACAQRLTGTDIQLLIENCGGFADYQREAIDRCLQCPSFGLTLDIGHSRTAGQRDEPFIFARADRLRHMHVHDATDAHNHLPLGEGDTDLLDYLNLAAARHCRAVLETKTADALRKSVGWIKENGLWEQ